MAKSKQNTHSSSIIENRSARHDYHILSQIEAGISLEGWEVKALRAGRVQIKETYALIQKGQVCLLNLIITPLATTCAYQTSIPDRTRKLLLHKKEIHRLQAAVQRDGFTLVPLSLYWKRSFIKVCLGLCKGKQQFDKRMDERKQEWKRTQQQLIKKLSRS